MGGDKKQELTEFIQEHSDLTGEDLNSFYDEFIQEEAGGKSLERPSCPLEKSSVSKPMKMKEGRKLGKGRKTRKRK